MCGGGGAPSNTTSTQKVELDPRMNELLYGSGGGSTGGLYGKAQQLLMNRTPQQSVAGFNPLQQFAMQQMANLAQSPNFGGQQTSNAVISKLLGRGGVNYQPQQFSMPQFDTSKMFDQFNQYTQPQATPAPVVQQQLPTAPKEKTFEEMSPMEKMQYIFNQANPGRTQGAWK